VPTADERKGIDTITYPDGTHDTLTVTTVDPRVVPVLASYPLPNDPTGSYGARTYAASSKVTTRTDQFSVRVDTAFRQGPAPQPLQFEIRLRARSRIPIKPRSIPVSASSSSTISGARV